MTALTRPTSLRPVPLDRLAALVGVASASGGPTAISGLSLGSKAIREGDLYAALPGARTHGARYAADAVEAGAVAVLTDPAGADIATGLGVPMLVIDEPRRALGRLAAEVYDHPADKLTVIGVTGTQGKTTVTHLIDSAAAAAGYRTAVVGTMGTRIAGERVSSLLTTPEAPDLHALFAVMVERGVDVCAMEVSSHALVMGRVDGVVFDLAAFTNFGRDHLDFHDDVEDYFAAKAQLFTPGRAKAALLNADDPAVMTLAGSIDLPVQTFGLDSAAQWQAVDVEGHADGSTFGLRTERPGGDLEDIRLAMPGRFNVANATLALAALGLVGLDHAAAARGLATVASVAGRMERVPNDRGIGVIVDYAHKPDALSATLDALRPVTAGRLFVVLGAGGDRDRGKRPIMGEIAARYADVVIVTDDNPRSEDPAAIRAELLAGIDGAAEVHELGDRREAIRRAVADARPGDTVLIAGKGHETGQYVGDEVLPFDDREVAATALAEVPEP